MIHYHGTPCSGSRIEAARFLHGRHALVSYAYQDDLAIVMQACQSFVLDNGAYTTFTKGRPLDVQGYVNWCEGIYQHPGFDWALIPDVINGTEQENDALLKDWPSHIAGVPVYHLHESLDRAERLSWEWDYVALGSSGQWPNPGQRLWWLRMAEVMSVMCDESGRARCKLHGLRMLDPDIFTNLPLKSADSTNATQNGLRNGRAFAPEITSGQGSILTSWRIEAHNSASNWDKTGIFPITERWLF